jgi:surfeit locus 1 family protein
MGIILLDADPYWRLRNLDDTQSRMATGYPSGKLNLWALSLGVALLALFVAAGIWQVKRAKYKESLQTQVASAANEPPISLSAASDDVRALNLHRVLAEGNWVADKTVFIDNKVSNGVIGYHVVTPLHIKGSGGYVLVNRGWIAAPPTRGELPRLATSAASIEVSGLARIPTGRFLELSNEVIEGRIWENLTIERFHTWSGLALLPVVIYQDAPSEANIVPVSPAPETSGLGADRHWGYAFMWFSLAVLTVVLMAVITSKAITKNEQN